MQLPEDLRVQLARRHFPWGPVADFRAAGQQSTSFHSESGSGGSAASIEHYGHANQFHERAGRQEATRF